MTIGGGGGGGWQRCTIYIYIDIDICVYSLHIYVCIVCMYVCIYLYCIYRPQVRFTGTLDQRPDRATCRVLGLLFPMSKIPSSVQNAVFGGRWGGGWKGSVSWPTECLTLRGSRDGRLSGRRVCPRKAQGYRASCGHLFSSESLDFCTRSYHLSNASLKGIMQSLSACGGSVLRTKTGSDQAWQGQA